MGEKGNNIFDTYPENKDGDCNKVIEKVTISNSKSRMNMKDFNLSRKQRK